MNNIGTSGSIGARLKELRERKGLSPEALKISLANRKDVNLSVSRETIDKWERNSRTPNAEAIRALALYYGVTSDYILGLDDYWAATDNLKITAVTLGFSDKATENLINLRSADGGLVSDVLSEILESDLLKDTMKELKSSRSGISRQLHYCKDYSEKHRECVPALFLEQALDLADVYIIKALRKTASFYREVLGYNEIFRYRKEATDNGEHQED